MKMYSNETKVRATHNRRAILRLLSLIAMAVSVMFNVCAADLAGTWKGSMQTQIGESQVTFTIQPGPALTGHVKVADYDGAIEKGKLTGDKISFETTIEHGKLTFDGTVAADQMELDVVGTQGDRYKLICVRQK